MLQINQRRRYKVFRDAADKTKEGGNRFSEMLQMNQRRQEKVFRDVADEPKKAVKGFPRCCR
jgi:hypothetical protein